MSVGPRIVDRSATKPIYLVIVEDLLEETKLAFYKSQSLIENGSYLELSGFQLTKKQADQLTKDPRATISAKTVLKAVNRKIPWHRIIRIDNVTYKQPQGETNEY